MATASAVVPALRDRPIKNTVVLFDVDETLTKARQVRFLNLQAIIPTSKRQRVPIPQICSGALADNQPSSSNPKWLNSSRSSVTRSPLAT